jgi:nicotinamidase-related amidase
MIGTSTIQVGLILSKHCYKYYRLIYNEKMRMDKYTKPDIARSALITIDTQNDFTLPDAPMSIAGTKEVVPDISALLGAYRSKGRLIIHVIRLYLRDGSNVDICRRQSIEDGKQMAEPGTEGAELVAELKPDIAVKLAPDELMAGNFQKIGNNEYVMYKPRWGAFYKTALEEFLQDRGIDTLVFSGCNFPNCPRTSIYEASERDFRVVLAQDAISQLYSKDKEELKNIGVSLLSASEIQKLLA